jgi:hypothetical protein
MPESEVPSPHNNFFRFVLSHVRVLRSSLQVLKYGRSERLEEKLREIYEQLRELAETGQLEVWGRAIRVYLMAVNKRMSTEEVDRIISDVVAPQIEPGSIAIFPSGKCRLPTFQSHLPPYDHRRFFDN